MRWLSVWLLLVVLAAPVFGQGQRRGGRRAPQGPQPGTQPSELLANFTGVVRGLSAKSLTIADAEDNEVQFECSKKTRYYDGDKAIEPGAIKPGDPVTVEARTMLDGRLEAVNVRLHVAKTS